MRRELYLFVLFIWLSIGQVGAYELETHGAMTLKAFDRVLQEDDQLISRLGIVLIQNNLGTSYYDASDNLIYERSIDKFEKRIMEEVDKEIKPQSLPGWLLRGAIREDDLGEIAGFSIGGDPHDDPYDAFFRVFHHFFDPVNNLPLNGVPTPDSGGTVHTAPAWALGTTSDQVFNNNPRATHYG
ncbi:MAG: hypothetical protein OEY67_02460 [Gammaproteobacteria bacterium]|nr:hypothetical protein [Gammaproteobacteria bacterium]